MLGVFVDFGGDIEKLISVVLNKGVNIEKIILIYGYLDYVGGMVVIVEYYNVFIVGLYVGDKFWLDVLM